MLKKAGGARHQIKHTNTAAVFVRTPYSIQFSVTFSNLLPYPFDFYLFYSIYAVFVNRFGRQNRFFRLKYKTAVHVRSLSSFRIAVRLAQFLRAVLDRRVVKTGF